MKCKNCGIQNNKGAKYCENCGKPLSETKGSSRTPKQNYKSKRKKNIGTKKPVSNKRIISNLLSLKFVWVFTTIFLLIIIMIVALTSEEKRFNRDNDLFIDNRSQNPLIEAKVFDIASKFVCGCGSCGEESLDICKCNFAVDERAFIREYLENNNSETDIIKAMVTKYGGLKDGVSLNNNSTAKINKPKAVNNGSTALANFNDRITIYSAFQCPCGQCGIDELKDCTCNHKNGAKEVKKFIDAKISENKYTVAQIIDVVDNTYGGKK
ncbi:MAG: zinc-ribbon domain-containing protein [Ignavibacteriae bacterium]|nr:zinc-ribbon domain-containing protein [Ignavibacteriota bacterium]